MTRISPEDLDILIYVADINPVGIDLTTGRLRRLSSNDILTTNGGVAAVGATGIQGATGISGTTSTTWASYTPTGNWVTNTTYTGMYRRVGDSLDLRARILLSGTPSGLISITIPSDLTIDTSKLLTAATTGDVLGSGVTVDVGVVEAIQL